MIMKLSGLAMAVGLAGCAVRGPVAQMAPVSAGTAPLPKGAELRFTVRRTVQGGTTNLVQVSFVAPGKGSWSVQGDSDPRFLAITVLESGSAVGGEHVTYSEACDKGCGFYRVEWNP